MQVEFLTSVPFPGWPDFEARLAKLPAPELALMLAQMVAQSTKQNDGRFVKEGFVSAVNLHIFQRFLLRQWSAEGWRLPTAEKRQSLQDDEAKREIANLMRALVDRRNQHPALAPKIELPKPVKIASGLWFSAQEQRFQNRSPKHEIARAWLMFQNIWPIVVETRKIPLAAPNLSAFESLPYALLMLTLMYLHDGWLPDVMGALSKSNLKGPALTSFLGCYTTAANDFVRHDRPADYPVGFVNPFGLKPVLRITDNVLFAPDPSIIFGALGFRLLQQALTAGTEAEPEDPDKGFERASSAFGFVFEEYVRLLLKELGRLSAGQQFRDEFRYKRGTDAVASPDAFLVGAAPLIFEFKSLRFPFHAEAEAHFTGLASWLTRMTGGKDGRSAFEQGVAFVRDAQARLFTEVGNDVAETAMYVMVGYEDIPLPANWPGIRKHIWGSELTPEALALEGRSVFISLRSLEIALAVAEFEASGGRNFCMGFAIREWWQSLKTGPAAFETPSGEPRLAPDFGNYLLEKYPDAVGYFPSLLREAWQKFQDATTDVAFDAEADTDTAEASSPLTQRADAPTERPVTQGIADSQPLVLSEPQASAGCRTIPD